MAEAQNLPQVINGSIDGIPALWIRQSTPGPISAGMVFRVGRGDEPLSQLGICHLIEHLALFSLGKTDYELNGEVDHLTTTFTVRGSSEEVRDFIQGVADSLNDLPYDRLDSERDILKAESQNRDPGAVGGISPYRYGTTSLGSLAFDEFGVEFLTSEQIEKFRKTHFNKSNVALWFTGEPPEGLTFSIPEGDRRDVNLRVIDQSNPGSIIGPEDGVALALSFERSEAAIAAGRILGHRMEQVLRTELALSYEVSTTAFFVTSDRGEVFITADVHQNKVEEMIDAFVTVVEDFKQNGPTEEELDYYKRKVVREILDSEFMPAILQSITTEQLTGGRSPELSDVIADVDGLTADSVRVAMSDAYRSAIFAIPEGNSLENYPAIAEHSESAVQGERYKSKFIAPIKGELIVGEEGISLIPNAIGKPLTILYKDLVAVLKSQMGGVGVIGIDGTGFDVDPLHWKNGNEAVRKFLSRVPSDLQTPASDERVGYGKVSVSGLDESAHFSGILKRSLPVGLFVAVLMSTQFGLLRGIAAGLLAVAVILSLILLIPKYFQWRLRSFPDGLAFGPGTITASDIDLPITIGGIRKRFIRIAQSMWLGHGQLVITENELLWRPQSLYEAGGVPGLRIPVEAISHVHIESKKLHVGAGILAVTLSRGRRLVFEVRVDQVRDAIQQVSEKFVSADIDDEDLYASNSSVQYGTFSRILLFVGWIVSFVIMFGPVSDNSPETYPAVVDFLGVSTFVVAFIAVVLLPVGAKFGFYLSLLASLLGLSVAIFDLDYAPQAGKLELLIFGFMFISTLSVLVVAKIQSKRKSRLTAVETSDQNISI